MTLLEQTFSNLREQNKKALAAFFMAGDPDYNIGLNVLREAEKYADIIEIGMPFSDPMADGPVIQAAGLRALKAGMSIDHVFKLVRDFRSKNDTTPIILMGYLNPLIKYGASRFAADCKGSGVDGLIIVDMPPEETAEIGDNLSKSGVSLIRLIAPTTDDKRLDKILEDASGFLYYVSITGVTGTATADPHAVKNHVMAVKEKTSLPVMVGFGIKTPDDAREMAKTGDGIIVGSALVGMIAGHEQDSSLASQIGDALSHIRSAIDEFPSKS